MWRLQLRRSAKGAPRRSRVLRPASVSSLSLALEPLEPRWLLATYFVNSPADLPDGDTTDHISDIGSANPMNPNFPLKDVSTLRSAIQQANADGVPAEIDFEISGGGVQTIFTTGLPAITVPITIDATTQPGFDPTKGKPLIELVGMGAAFGLTLVAPGSKIKGLSIHGFTGADILVNSGTNTITGNYIGLDPSGTLAPGNGNGITITGPDNTVGGHTVAERNVISGSLMGSGVSLVSAGATGNVIEGNYIGTDWVGLSATSPTKTPLGNGIGVRIVGASGNFVGTGAAADRNLISGNISDGILISDGSTNLVQGDTIGTDFTGTTGLPNGIGVLLNGGASGNTIGGTVAGEGDVISGNTGNGVEIDGGGGVNATGNFVQGNLIGITDTNAVLANNNGVAITAGATDNTVGGSAAARNIISANLANGVLLTGAGTSTNKVQDNYIGTSIDGTLPLGNGYGVQITGGADDNFIGGASSPTASLGNVISGNKFDGVGIVSAGAMGNTLEGNFIGTDKNGNRPIANKSDGVRIVGSANNQIGAKLGASPDNLISGNAHEAVDISGANATDNFVQGNYIGTDLAGTTALGNGGGGVVIATGAENNTIGGDATQRNLISANLNGIEIINAGNAGNTVRGNYIGTDKNGATSKGLDLMPLGNQLDGVVVSDSSNNKIGELLGANPDNVISGNGEDGVAINGDAANAIRSMGNKVQGNYIGTDATGQLPLGNTADGVFLADDAVMNLVGGGADERNVISANLHGIHISDATTMTNRVENNYIGTDATGLTALGSNGKSMGNATGVVIDTSANNNSIGAMQAQGNVISGNTTGVLISDAGTTANLVQGNLIGTDNTGKAVDSAGGNPLGNTGFGIQIEKGADTNTVGGAGLANVISGNLGGNVLITDVGTNGNLVQSNMIGLDIDGGTALPNTEPINSAVGVSILAGASNNTIGGVTFLALGNTISGNRGDGVLISGAGTNGNMIQGNTIGTNLAGNTAVGKDGKPLGNDGFGVDIAAGAANTMVGGGPFLGNTISGNRSSGVAIVGAATTPNFVQRNFIGTDVSGAFDVDTNNQPLGNAGDGILISGAPGNTIGGAPGSGNEISGNLGNGVSIVGAGATTNTLDDNQIGVDVVGGPLGNTLDGVRIEGPLNTVGAAAPGVTADNTIDFNGRAGIAVISGTGNKISGNGIFGNKALGIDLNGDGVTLNTPGSPHTGPNLLTSYPVLTSVSQPAPGTLIIAGTLDSTRDTNYTIELFASASADVSGFGQGQAFIGQVNNVLTDDKGHAVFNAMMAGSVPPGGVVTATARDNANNTSEFSAAFPLAAKLSGTVFLDYNASGVQDPGEPGLAHRTVYVDLNHDGVLDNGEPSATTDANGNFSFGNMPAGVYHVRENLVKDHGVVITAPTGGFYTVTVPGALDTKLNFGNVLISQVSPVEVVANRFRPAPDADTAFVQGVYRNLLARDPDSGGAMFWDKQLLTGMPRPDFVRRIWESSEHRGLQVDHYFQTLFGRAADLGGRNFWMHAFLAGVDEQQVVVGLMSSPEYRTLHPTDAQFVDAVFADVLSRDADTGGAAFWETALKNGASRGQVAAIFVNSAESNRRVVDGYFAAILHRGSDVGGADFWSSQLARHRQTLESVAITFLASDEYFAAAQHF